EQLGNANVDSDLRPAPVARGVDIRELQSRLSKNLLRAPCRRTIGFQAPLPSATTERTISGADYSDLIQSGVRYRLSPPEGRAVQSYFFAGFSAAFLPSPMIFTSNFPWVSTRTTHSAPVSHRVVCLYVEGMNS